ncbi:cytochrome B6 [Calothrix sp. HK-06]|nr:cytochrome B6 [Calothrix sp. HK-06]
MLTTQFDKTLRRVSTILSVVLLTLFFIGASTGILLSFYYEPGAGAAYNSLAKINTEVGYGWLFHKAHSIAGNGMIVVSLVQIVVMFLSRQFRKSWLIAWVSGIFLTLAAIGLDWTAIILGWTQDGYWRFSIELGTIESIPFVGHLLRDILTGGGATDSVTVQHLYTIHSYIVSVFALVFAIVHLVGVLKQEKEMYATSTNEATELQPQPLEVGNG